MHLADGKVVKVERQVRRDIGVRGLFVRQDNVQADRLATRISGATVPGLHHPRPATGHDDILTPVGFKAALGHDAGKAARFVIVVRQVGQRLGPCGAALFRGRYPRAAEHDDGGFDPPFVHDQLRLQKFKLQPHRAQFLTRQEIAVGKGKAIGRGPGLWRVGDALGGGDILHTVAERVAAGFVFHSGRSDCVGVGSAL